MISEHSIGHGVPGWFRIFGEIAPGVFRAIGELYLTVRSRRFLTIGFSGTGKTQLLGSVLGARIESDPLRPTLETRMGDLQLGNSRLLVADTAGNPSVFEDFVREEIENAQTGRYLGILNVTAYGYNESRGPATNDRHQIPAYREGAVGVNPEFLEIERQQELIFLKTWVSVAAATGRIGWILCAMNKYDLWFEQQDDVASYYGHEGDYGKLIVNEFGRSSYSTSAACAEISDFQGRSLPRGRGLPQSEATHINDIFLARLRTLMG